MSKTKVTLDLGAFKALRNSPEMLAILQQEADAMAARAGDGYAVLSPAHAGANRGSVTVGPVTAAAVAAEARDHLLLGAIHG